MYMDLGILGSPGVNSSGYQGTTVFGEHIFGSDTFSMENDMKS